MKWCRSGICILKTAAFEKYTVLSKPLQSEGGGGEKSNLIDDRKFGNLMKSEHSLNRLSLVIDGKSKHQGCSSEFLLFSVWKIDFNVERMDETE